MGFGLQKNHPPLSTPLKPTEAGFHWGFPHTCPVLGRLGASWGVGGRRQEGQAGGSELLRAALGAGCLGRRGAEQLLAIY